MGLDSKAIMARNILVRQSGLTRTTAAVLASRWTEDQVEAVIKSPPQEVDSVLAGITPPEFLPEKMAGKVQRQPPVQPEVKPAEASEPPVTRGSMPADDM